MMAASFFLFLVVGLYLDNVLPNAFGLRKHWLFCITPSFWFGTNEESQLRAQRRKARRAVDVEAATDDEVYFEAKHMKKENFEPVSREILKQEKDKKILKITEL